MITQELDKDACENMLDQEEDDKDKPANKDTFKEMLLLLRLSDSCLILKLIFSFPGTGSS